MDWSAAQYLKFEAERNRPIEDLLTRVAVDPVRAAADLGCGPGNSTEYLAAKFRDALICGIDSSPDMIETARKRMPQAAFTVADIADWSATGPFDVILANASLQWVSDQERVLPALMAKLTPKGCLAVQVPDNLAEPSHVLMRKVATEGPWAERLAAAWAGWTNRRSADWYYGQLQGVAGSIDLWRTTYFHALADGHAAIAEWFSGSALRPFLAPLDGAERAQFLNLYLDEIAQAYPLLPNGSVLLPFPRLFFVARR